jgi:hypothetical protein
MDRRDGETTRERDSAPASLSNSARTGAADPRHRAVVFSAPRARTPDAISTRARKRGPSAVFGASSEQKAVLTQKSEQP